MASSDLQITHTAVWTIWDPLLLRHVVRQRAPHDAHHFGDVGVEVGEDGALGTSGQGSICFVKFTPSIW